MKYPYIAVITFEAIRHASGSSGSPHNAVSICLIDNKFDALMISEGNLFQLVNDSLWEAVFSYYSPFVLVGLVFIV